MSSIGKNNLFETKVSCQISPPLLANLVSYVSRFFFSFMSKFLLDKKVFKEQK